jgi:hypothetical protein
MADYMILIYGEEPAGDYGPEDFKYMGELHGKFYERYADKIKGGLALEKTTTATSVRGDAVTDGPFVETKEVLGGYYLVDAENLDEAIEIAKAVPAPKGGVEVRPVMDTSGM